MGYRAFVRRQALVLGLSGQVRNLCDGRVEALVRGSISDLDQFRQILLQGPPHGQVVTLVVKEVDEVPTFEGFFIQEDGLQPWYEV